MSRVPFQWIPSVPRLWLSQYIVKDFLIHVYHAAIFASTWILVSKVFKWVGW